MEQKLEHAIAATKNLTFGEALQALKNGYQIGREGWNGKGMYLWLNKGNVPYEDIISDSSILPLKEGVPRTLFEYGDTDTITRMPNINMKTATGSIVTGWLASQTDMLAEDWLIIE